MAERNSATLLSFLEAAIKVLQESPVPLTADEITEQALAEGLITTSGNTPINSMTSMLYTAVRAKHDSQIVKVSLPGLQRARRGSVRWGLRGHENSRIDTTVPLLSRRQRAKSTQKPPRRLPRMDKLLEWGVVRPGDRVYVDGWPHRAGKVVDDHYVEESGQQLRYYDWARQVTGWEAVNIYQKTVHVPTGKTLSELRREEMERRAANNRHT